MTAIDFNSSLAPRWRPSLSARHIPVITTALVWLLLIVGSSIRYHDQNFLSAGVFINLLRDNAFLGIAAVGMTFVILSGGIDLSVGSMVGFTSILIGHLIGAHHVSPLLAVPLALIIGTLFGAAMGYVIGYIHLPPFLVTLAGMFLARGLGQVISLESVTINSPIYEVLNGVAYQFRFFGTPILHITAIVFLLTLAAGVFVAHQTRFGRAVYAVGGNEQSALLMGVPVAWTKIKLYALSGFCSALAGVVYTLYNQSGNASAGIGLELDAIAAVVIGGTPLSGGIGYVLGTLIGVLILGTIQTILSFEGNLSSWWAKIAIGVLLLAFILLQKGVGARVGRKTRR